MQVVQAGSNDAFITKLDSAGAGVFSTFLGGAFVDNGLSVDVDSQGRAAIAGSTSSTDFPIFDSVQANNGGASDGFIAQFAANGSSLVYSTYFGGNGADQINGVAIAPEGNAVVVGLTTSANLPTARPLQNASGGQDAFIAKIGVSADLEIIKTDARDPVMVNNSLVYNLRVTNNGPSTATAVTVTDDLPAGTNFVSATTSQGSCANNNGRITCALGALSNNAAATITLTVTPIQVGTIQNTAAVTGSEPDATQSNNTATQQTTVSALPSIAGRIALANGQPLPGRLTLIWKAFKLEGLGRTLPAIIFWRACPSKEITRCAPRNSVIFSLRVPVPSTA